MHRAPVRPAPTIEAEDGPGVPEALPRAVREMAGRLGHVAIDCLWIFPPMVRGRREWGPGRGQLLRPGNEPQSGNVPLHGGANGQGSLPRHPAPRRGRSPGRPASPGDGGGGQTWAAATGESPPGGARRLRGRLRVAHGGTSRASSSKRLSPGCGHRIEGVGAMRFGPADVEPYLSIFRPVPARTGASGHTAAEGGGEGRLFFAPAPVGGGS